jgi:hypothetical protein
MLAAAVATAKSYLSDFACLFGNDRTQVNLSSVRPLPRVDY